MFKLSNLQPDEALHTARPNHLPCEMIKDGYLAPNGFVCFTETLMSNTINQFSPRQCGVNLFLVGFLVLFLELASIRWFSANVIFLQFFTNVVLIACFLGMSCGCMAARQHRDLLAYFPLLALGTISAGIATLSQPSEDRACSTWARSWSFPGRECK